MVKSREEKGLNKKHNKENCDFCGHHKDDVPLLVVSNNTKVAICSWCALGVVEQTFKHGLTMEKAIRDSIAMNKKRKNPPTPPAPPPAKLEVVPAGHKPDKVDIAIGKALKRGK